MPGYAKIENGKIALHMPEGGVAAKQFSSGDVGTIDAHGRLTLTGRITNVINVEGIKISPEQIEAVLCAQSGVLEAAAFAILDERKTSRPAALIKANAPDLNLKALAEACAQKLGPKARPIRLVVVDEIPKTANGKIQRTALLDVFSQKTKTVSLVLGLSHIFGETAQRVAQVQFWQQHGLKHEFDETLPVTPEKQASLLNNTTAQSVAMSYLTLGKGVVTPGIEFVAHPPQVPKKSSSGIALFLKADKNETVTDLDGNQVFFDARLQRSPTLVVTTSSAQKTQAFFTSLGFAAHNLEQDELDFFAAKGFPVQAIAHQAGKALFQNLSARLLVREDLTRQDLVKVDDVGWNGLSFLVQDLDALAKQIPLLGYQKIQDGGEVVREVAFYQQHGVLCEFLRMRR
jgi:hypothetical protein